MSYINVSTGEISGLESALRELLNKIRNGKDSVNSVASHFESKVSEIDRYTHDKMNTMTGDRSLALHAISVNEIAKKKAQGVVNELKKAQERASEAYREAVENQTKVNNSSSGSTEEEKKAHAAAVKSANNAVSSASSNVSSIAKQVSNAQSVVDGIQKKIDRLNEIIRNINRSHEGAANFLSSVRTLHSNFKDAKSTFMSKVKKMEEEVEETIQSVEKAKTDIEKALKHFAKACNCSENSRVCMSSTAPLTKAINMLIDTKSKVTDMSKNIVKESTIYNVNLGSDISSIATKKITEITSIMVKQTEDYNRMAEELKYAKSNLDSYCSLA